ncbi:MAG TPA: GNAT family N-acetyltransferase [Chitinophagales bacterium]|nr:GNAT family N-acetyltransferase [Chitinophagales bacterium]
MSTYLYFIGDLDDKFWGRCQWFSANYKGEIQAVVLVFNGSEIPTVLAMAHNNLGIVRELLRRIQPQLPAQFYSHLSPGVLDELDGFSIAKHYGLHYRMMLGQLPLTEEGTGIRRIGIGQMQEVLRLYHEAYPGNWFEGYMLEKGYYLGYYHAELLVAVAGTHIYSPHYNISALGNITTHPAHRGRGIARRLTATLTNRLYGQTTQIGLNVHAGNGAALKVYTQCGYATTGSFNECLVNNLL